MSAPQQPPADLVALAKSIAVSQNLYPELVCAIVEQESSWRTTATRYEPLFQRTYIDKLGLSEPEATYRATSWGLMQIMGESARERGYLEDLPTLLEPTAGLTVGCKHFANRLDVADGNVTRALLLWNGGGNAEYPSQVLARVDRYREAGTPLPEVPDAT